MIVPNCAALKSRQWGEMVWNLFWREIAASRIKWIPVMNFHWVFKLICYIFAAGYCFGFGFAICRQITSVFREFATLGSEWSNNSFGTVDRLGYQADRSAETKRNDSLNQVLVVTTKMEKKKIPSKMAFTWIRQRGDPYGPMYKKR